jgi:hypothetical protein
VSVSQTNPAYPAQFVDGFQASLHVAAGIAFAAALVALTLVRQHVHEPALAAEMG